MSSRVTRLNKRFYITLNYILTNRNVKVMELAKELKSKLGLKYSTSNTYASKILYELSSMGVLERMNREYRLTPKGWYLIYRFFEYYYGYSQDLNRSTLFECLKREDKPTALLIPALEIVLEIYQRLTKSEEEEEISEIEDLYSEFLSYLDLFSEEIKEPSSWRDILDLIIPPLEEIPTTLFLNLLRDRLKEKNKLEKAIMKDLLMRKAELLERDADDLKRRARELERSAQDLRKIAEVI